MPRDEFRKEVRESLAARVGFRCSNPDCQKITSGPSVDPARAFSIGVAAHITAAAPGGPRFDASLTPEQRSSIENAIWLCQSCGTMVDRDPARFPELVLREWKQRMENAARIELHAGSEFRAIAASEVRQELTVGELAVIRALSEEFGCHVESDVDVPAGDGWLNLHAAVVRGEDLVGIEIRELHGRGIPYFQIEGLIEWGTKLRFPRFRKFVLYIAVVSDQDPEVDESVQTRLDELAKAATCEVYVRMYRLNTLLAKYGL